MRGVNHVNKHLGNEERCNTTNYSALKYKVVDLTHH